MSEGGDRAGIIYGTARDEVASKREFTTGYAKLAWDLLVPSLTDLVNSAWGGFSPNAIPAYTTSLWPGLTASTLLNDLFPDPPDHSGIEITDPPGDPAEPVYGDPPGEITYTIPPDPVIHEFTVPDCPPLNLPTFTEVLGLDPSIVPTVSIDAGSLDYDSSLTNTLLARLENDIINGGTGLSADVETAIWQREKEREEQNLADAIDKLEDTFARKAFMLPSSVMAEQLTILTKDWENRQIDRSREIMIKQAELEQENLKLRLTLAVDIEKHLSDLWERTQTRIFNASVKIAEFAYETFKSQIAQFNAAIDAYKAKAEVYKNQIEGEIAKVEAYKAQIEGLKAIAELDDVIVKAFIGKIQAVVAKVDMYKAQVQAYVARIEGERAKIELYGARITAWGAKIKAIIDIYLGEMEGGKSYIDGLTKIENVNVQGLGESVRAYAAQMVATAGQNEAMIRQSMDTKQAVIEAQKTLSTIYANIFSAMALSISAQVHLQGSGQGSVSYAETKTLT